MHLFQGNRQGESLLISDSQEVNHCLRVTRHHIRDKILVTEFNGIIWKGTIKEIDSNVIEVELGEEYAREKENRKICIAISTTQQSDRFEWFIEKATETGVHHIIPVICQRTENSKNKIDRWNKIILSSAKQCLRTSLLKISEPIKISEFLKTSLPNQRYICHCEDQQIPHLGLKYNPNEDVVVMIGPEGDFTHQEIEMAKSFNFLEVGLGNERLRVETAGIAAGIIIKTMNYQQ